MNVNLGEKFERFIQEKVASGRYQSASEVVREALRLLEERDELTALEREVLRQEIRVGLEQSQRGQVVDGPKAVTRIRRKLGTRGRP